MSTKIILIVLWEPNSTFSEILFKYFISKKFKNNKKRIVLIGSYKLLSEQMKKLKYKIKLNQIYKINKSIKKKVNVININYKFKNAFSNISDVSNKYIEDCFNLGLKLMTNNLVFALINGPISKKHFLKKRFPGITE